MLLCRPSVADKASSSGSGAAGGGNASSHTALGAPTEAAASVAARGATFSAADGDLTLPWLGQLGDFFSVAYSGDLPEAAPPPPLDLDVHLQVTPFSLLCYHF